MTVTVRRAGADDGRAIAEIRVASWRTAYDGLMPPVLLERLDVDREAQLRTVHWDERHADPRVSDFIAYADGEAVGWAAVGPCRDDDGPHRGELYALYALPAHWSTGVGHALMGVAEQALRDARFAIASLWVLDGNARAADFYERHGWREDGMVKDDERIVGSTGAVPLRERRRVRDLAESVSR